MKRFTKLCISLAFLIAFGIWTVLVRTVDIRAIGPCGSMVGFATLNESIHVLTGVNMSLYSITDWMGLVPIAMAFAFAALGVAEWIMRRNLFEVDLDILTLGALYACVMGFYFFFEAMPINYRPILIDGFLEASYPSSTTLITLTVMPTAAAVLSRRIKSRRIAIAVTFMISAFTVFTVIGRVISGVHWITDIIGAALLSASVDTAYFAVSVKACEEAK